MKNKLKHVISVLLMFATVFSSFSAYARGDKKSEDSSSSEFEKLPSIGNIKLVKSPKTFEKVEKKEIPMPENEERPELLSEGFKMPVQIGQEVYYEGSEASGSEFLRGSELTSEDEYFDGNVEFVISPEELTDYQYSQTAVFGADIQGRKYENVFAPFFMGEGYTLYYYNFAPLYDLQQLREFKGYVRDLYIYKNNPYELHCSSFAQMNNAIDRNDIDNVIYKVGSFSKMFLTCFLALNLDKLAKFCEGTSLCWIKVYGQKKNKKDMRIVTFYLDDYRFFKYLEDRFS